MTELRNVRILSEDETLELAERLSGEVDNPANPNQAIFYGPGLGSTYRNYLGENVMIRGYLMNGKFQKTFKMLLFMVDKSEPRWKWEFKSSASKQGVESHP